MSSPTHSQLSDGLHRLELRQNSIASIETQNDMTDTRIDGNTNPELNSSRQCDVPYHVLDSGVCPQSSIPTSVTSSPHAERGSSLPDPRGLRWPGEPAGLENFHL